MDDERNAADARHIQHLCSGTDGQREQAMKAIDLAHRRRLERYFLRNRQVADAQDLAQEVLIKLLHAACQVAGGAPVVAWLLKTARHALIDRLRALKRRTQIDGPGHSANDELLPEMPDHLMDISVVIANQDFVQKALALLRKHSPDHAEILHLRAVEAMDYEALGEILGKSDKAARQYASQAKQKLELICRGLESGLTPVDILAELRQFNTRKRSRA